LFLTFIDDMHGFSECEKKVDYYFYVITEI